MRNAIDLPSVTFWWNSSCSWHPLVVGLSHDFSLRLSTMTRQPWGQARYSSWFIRVSVWLKTRKRNNQYLSCFRMEDYEVQSAKTPLMKELTLPWVMNSKRFEFVSKVNNGLNTDIRQLPKTLKRNMLMYSYVLFEFEWNFWKDW